MTKKSYHIRNVKSTYKSRSKPKHISNKYKHNKRKLKTRRKYKYNLHGSGVGAHNILKHINSLGFEIETIDLIKFTKQPNEDGSGDILLNSALTNADL